MRSSTTTGRRRNPDPHGRPWPAEKERKKKKSENIALVFLTTPDYLSYGPFHLRPAQENKEELSESHPHSLAPAPTDLPRFVVKRETIFSLRCSSARNLYDGFFFLQQQPVLIRRRTRVERQVGRELPGRPSGFPSHSVLLIEGA